MVGVVNQIYSQKNLEVLKQNIENELASTSGTFAVAFQEVGNNENKILINETIIFHAASTMKTPVMIEVFKQAGEGKFSLDKSIIVKNEFKSIVDGSSYNLDLSSDSDDKLYSLIGQKQKIYDLVYDMITVSSNLATNLLIELVGANKIYQTMKKLGLENLKVLRGVEDIKAYELGLNNTTDALSLMKLYLLIAEKKILTEKNCDAMIKILLDQKFNDKIPKYLPSDVKVAHKTGSISRVEHDSGIVFLPDGKQYVIVVLSKDLDDATKGRETIARISKLIYDYIKN